MTAVRRQVRLAARPRAARTAAAGGSVAAHLGRRRLASAMIVLGAASIGARGGRLRRAAPAARPRRSTTPPRVSANATVPPIDDERAEPGDQAPAPARRARRRTTGRSTLGEISLRARVARAPARRRRVAGQLIALVVPDLRDVEIGGAGALSLAARLCVVGLRRRRQVARIERTRARRHPATHAGCGGHDRRRWYGRCGRYWIDHPGDRTLVRRLGVVDRHAELRRTGALAQQLD